MKIKAITFNICHGEGIDGVIDIKRQAEFINKYNPDILILQELDMYTLRVHKRFQLEEMSKYTGLKYKSMCSTIRYKEGFYGIGTLNKYPVESAVNFPMMSLYPENEKRGILFNKVRIEDKIVNIFNLHLATMEHERILAIEELVNIIETIPKNENIIVAGDFNIGISKIGNHKYSFENKETYTEYETLKKRLSKLPNTEPTWFSETAIACIDTMFYSSNMKLIEVKTLKSEISDHCAVFAEFEI